MGKWLRMVIHRVAMPFLYPFKKNHTANRQNAVTTASIIAMGMLTVCVAIYSRTESSQNQKCEKICVMA